jgi:hypothetical protein
MASWRSPIRATLTSFEQLASLLLTTADLHTFLDAAAHAIATLINIQDKIHRHRNSLARLPAAAIIHIHTYLPFKQAACSRTICQGLAQALSVSCSLAHTILYTKRQKPVIGADLLGSWGVGSFSASTLAGSSLVFWSKREEQLRRWTLEGKRQDDLAFANLLTFAGHANVLCCLTALGVIRMISLESNECLLEWDVPAGGKLLLDDEFLYHIPHSSEHCRLVKYSRVDGRVMTVVRFQHNFPSPQSVALHRDHIFILTEHEVQVFLTSGQFVRKWGCRGSGLGEFRNPWGITATEEQVFVTDLGNKRVQVFSHAGVPFFEIACAELSFPADVYVVANRMYVSDFVKRRVFVWQLESIPWK